MAFDEIKLDRPLSRLEILMTIILISACAGWLMHRIRILEAAAEARALDLTLRNARIGIMVTVATKLLQEGEEQIAALAEANPVGSVIEPPPGYIGALRQANPVNIQPGQWYFDEDGRFLAYHIVNTEYYEHSGDGPAQVRIRLKLNYDDRNGNGAYDSGVDLATSVSLLVLDPPKWKF